MFKLSYLKKINDKQDLHECVKIMTFLRLYIYYSSTLLTVYIITQNNL